MSTIDEVGKQGGRLGGGGGYRMGGPDKLSESEFSGFEN